MNKSGFEEVCGLAPRLSSIFLLCSDLEKSLAFYTRLGFRLKTSKKRSHVLSAGGKMELHLHSTLTEAEMEKYGLTGGPGSGSLVQSFRVPSLEKLLMKLEPQHLVTPPHTSAWGQEIALVADPDGHRLEFQLEE